MDSSVSRATTTRRAARRRRRGPRLGHEAPAIPSPEQRSLAPARQRAEHPGPPRRTSPASRYRLVLPRWSVSGGRGELAEACSAVYAVFVVVLLRVRRRYCRTALGIATAAMSCSVDVAEPPALVVEPFSLSVLLEDRAEGPAVTVEVGELGMSAPAGSGRSVLQEPRVGPEPVRRGLVGVRHLRLGVLLRGRVLLLASGTSARRRSPRPTTCSRGSC